jgi:uncharacterized membrane protein YdbT with pleckstrin-like domain
MAHKKTHRSVDDYSEIMRREKPTRNHWRAYLPKPERMAFDSQTTEEKILLVLRQHPITLLKQAAIILVMMLLPLFVHASFLTEFLTPPYMLALTLGWYMLIFSYALATFLIWFFSVYIITDERIIDVDFVSLLFKDVSSAKIDSIQDISSKTGGFLASVVDYGTVFIQTAGEQREIEFDSVPHPARVAALLNELLLEEEREKAEGRVQ